MSCGYVVPEFVSQRGVKKSQKPSFDVIKRMVKGF
jgi:hypothetical protein